MVLVFVRLDTRKKNRKGRGAQRGHKGSRGEKKTLVIR